MSWTKSTALGLCASLLFTMIVPPFAEAGIWSERKQSLQDLTDRKERSRDAFRSRKGVAPYGLKEGLEIPPDLGTIVDGWAPASQPEGPLVIHIQDAHGLYAAQKNVSEILKLLPSRPDIYAEGAWAAVDLEWLSAFPDPEIKEDFAERLLLEGKITGEQHRAIIDGAEKVRIQGIEDRKTYEANLKTRKVIEGRRRSILGALARRESSVQESKKRLYRGKLEELDIAARQYGSEKASLKDYLRFLRACGPPLLPYPNLLRYSELARMEEALSLGALKREREEFVQALEPRLDSPSLLLLSQSSLNFRLGKLSPLAYHEGLLKLAQANRMPAPALEAYVLYLEKSAAIEPARVSSELAEYERKTFELAAAQDPSAARLFAEDRRLKREIKFWQEKFAPADWREYLEENRSRAAAGQAQLKFLQEAYYKLAFRRDGIMVENMLKIARESRNPQSAVVLIAGGFHTPGMTQALRGKNIPYIVVQPRLTLSGRDALKTAPDIKEERFNSAMKAYAEHLQDLKNRGLSGKEIETALLILKDRLRVAGSAAQGDDVYVFGSYQGARARKNFAIKFSRSPDRQSQAARPFDGFFLGVTGSVRELLDVVAGGQDKKAAIMMDMLPSAAGPGKGYQVSQVLSDGGIETSLAGLRFTAREGWSLSALLERLRTAFAFSGIEPEMEGDALVFHKKPLMAQALKDAAPASAAYQGLMAARERGWIDAGQWTDQRIKFWGRLGVIPEMAALYAGTLLSGQVFFSFVLYGIMGFAIHFPLMLLAGHRAREGLLKTLLWALADALVWAVYPVCMPFSTFPLSALPAVIHASFDGITIARASTYKIDVLKGPLAAKEKAEIISEVGKTSGHASFYGEHHLNGAGTVVLVARDSQGESLGTLIADLKYGHIVHLGSSLQAGPRDLEIRGALLDRVLEEAMDRGVAELELKFRKGTDETALRSGWVRKYGGDGDGGGILTVKDVEHSGSDAFELNGRQAVYDVSALARAMDFQPRRIPQKNSAVSEAESPPVHAKSVTLKNKILTVRTVRPSDLPAVLEAHREFWKHKPDIANLYSLEDLERYRKEDPLGIMVAVNEGKILGVLLSARMQTEGRIEATPWTWEQITDPSFKKFDQRYDSRCLFSVGATGSAGTPLIYKAAEILRERELWLEHLPTLSPSTYGEVKDKEYLKKWDELRKDFKPEDPRDFDLDVGFPFHIKESMLRNHIDYILDFHMKKNHGHLGPIFRRPMRPDCQITVSYSYDWALRGKQEDAWPRDDPQQEFYSLLTLGISLEGFERLGPALSWGISAAAQAYIGYALILTGVFMSIHYMVQWLRYRGDTAMMRSARAYDPSGFRPPATIGDVSRWIGRAKSLRGKKRGILLGIIITILGIGLAFPDLLQAALNLIMISTMVGTIFQNEPNPIIDEKEVGISECPFTDLTRFRQRAIISSILRARGFPVQAKTDEERTLKAEETKSIQLVTLNPDNIVILTNKDKKQPDEIFVLGYLFGVTGQTGEFKRTAFEFGVHGPDPETPLPHQYDCRGKGLEKRMIDAGIDAALRRDIRYVTVKLPRKPDEDLKNFMQTLARAYRLESVETVASQENWTFDLWLGPNPQGFNHGRLISVLLSAFLIVLAAASTVRSAADTFLGRAGTGAKTEIVLKADSQAPSGDPLDIFREVTLALAIRRKSASSKLARRSGTRKAMMGEDVEGLKMKLRARLDSPRNLASFLKDCDRAVETPRRPARSLSRKIKRYAGHLWLAEGGRQETEQTARWQWGRAEAEVREWYRPKAATAPIESWNPVLKALTALTADEEVRLTASLKEAVRRDPDLRKTVLVDHLLLLAGDVPPDREERLLPNLKGRTLYRISAEGRKLWRGGLGPVLTFLGDAMGRLTGRHIHWAEIELDYEKNRNPERKLENIKGFATPVKDVREHLTFTMPFRGNPALKVRVSRGMSPRNTPTYFLKDVQADGSSWYANTAYDYKAEDNWTTLEESSEFLAKAALHLIAILEERAMEERGDSWKAPVIFTNDAQTALAAVLLGLKDDPSNLFWQAFDRRFPKAKKIFNGALNAFLSHTYRNRESKSNTKDRRDVLMAMTGITDDATLDKIFLRLHRNPGEAAEEVLDWTTGALRSAGWKGGVSWKHAFDIMRFFDQGLHVVGLNNGGSLEWSARFFRESLRRIFGQVDVERPSGEETLAAKADVKERFFNTVLDELNLRPAIKQEADRRAYLRYLREGNPNHDDNVRDGHFIAAEKEVTAEYARRFALDPGRMTVGYIGRLVSEKFGWSDKEIRDCLSAGHDILIVGAVQKTADSENIVRRLESLRSDYAQLPGRLIFIPLINNEKLKQHALSAFDLLALISDPDSEANGYLEAAGSAAGAIIVGPATQIWQGFSPGAPWALAASQTWKDFIKREPWARIGEGFIHGQGLPLNLQVPGEGNTLSMSLGQAIEIMGDLFKTDRKKFGEYQATSVCLSRIWDAFFTAATALRQWNAALEESAPAKAALIFNPFVEGLKRGNPKTYLGLVLAAGPLLEEWVFRHMALGNLGINSQNLISFTGLRQALGVSILLFSAAHIFAQWFVRAKNEDGWIRGVLPSLLILPLFRYARKEDIKDFLKYLIPSVLFTAVHLAAATYLPFSFGFSSIHVQLADIASVLVHGAVYNALVVWAQRRYERFLWRPGAKIPGLIDWLSSLKVAAFFDGGDLRSKVRPPSGSSGPVGLLGLWGWPWFGKVSSIQARRDIGWSDRKIAVRLGFREEVLFSAVFIWGVSWTLSLAGVSGPWALAFSSMFAAAAFPLLHLLLGIYRLTSLNQFSAREPSRPGTSDLIHIAVQGLINRSVYAALFAPAFFGGPVVMMALIAAVGAGVTHMNEVGNKEIRTSVLPAGDFMFAKDFFRAESLVQRLQLWGASNDAQNAAILCHVPEKDVEKAAAALGLDPSSLQYREIRGMMDLLARARKIPYRPPKEGSELIVQNQMDAVLQCSGNPEALLLIMADKLQALEDARGAEATDPESDVQLEIRHIYAPWADHLNREDIGQQMWSASLRKLIGDEDYDEVERTGGEFDPETLQFLEAKVTDWLYTRKIPFVAITSRRKSASSRVIRAIVKPNEKIQDFANITVVFPDEAAKKLAIQKRITSSVGGGPWHRDDHEKGKLIETQFQQDGLEFKLIDKDSYEESLAGEKAHMVYKLMNDLEQTKAFKTQQVFRASGIIPGPDFRENFWNHYDAVKERRILLLFDKASGTVWPTDETAPATDRTRGFEAFRLNPGNPAADLAPGSDLSRLTERLDALNVKSYVTIRQPPSGDQVVLWFSWPFHVSGTVRKIVHALRPVGNIHDIEKFDEDGSELRITLDPGYSRKKLKRARSEIRKIDVSREQEFHGQARLAGKATFEITARDRRGMLDDMFDSLWNFNHGILITKIHTLSISDGVEEPGKKEEKTDGEAAAHNGARSLKARLGDVEPRQEGKIATFILKVRLPEGVKPRDVLKHLRKDRGYLDVRITGPKRQKPGSILYPYWKAVNDGALPAPKGWLGKILMDLGNPETSAVWETGVLALASHFSFGWTILGFAFSHVIVYWIVWSKVPLNQKPALGQALSDSARDALGYLILGSILVFPFYFFTTSEGPWASALIGAMASFVIHQFYNEIALKVPGDPLISRSRGERRLLHRLTRTPRDHRGRFWYITADFDRLGDKNKALGSKAVVGVNGKNLSPDIVFSRRNFSLYRTARSALLSLVRGEGGQAHQGVGGDEIYIDFEGERADIERRLDRVREDFNEEFHGRYSQVRIARDSSQDADDPRWVKKLKSLESLPGALVLARYGIGHRLLIDRLEGGDDSAERIREWLDPNGYGDVQVDEIHVETASGGLFTLSIGAVSAEDVSRHIFTETGQDLSGRPMELQIWGRRLANDMLNRAKVGRNSVFVAPRDLSRRENRDLIRVPVTLDKVMRIALMPARERFRLAAGLDVASGDAGYMDLGAFKDKAKKGFMKGALKYLYLVEVSDYGMGPERGFHELQSLIRHDGGNEVIRRVSEAVHAWAEPDRGPGLGQNRRVLYGRAPPDRFFVAASHEIRGPPQMMEQALRRELTAAFPEVALDPRVHVYQVALDEIGGNGISKLMPTFGLLFETINEMDMAQWLLDVMPELPKNRLYGAVRIRDGIAIYSPAKEKVAALHRLFRRAQERESDEALRSLQGSPQPRGRAAKKERSLTAWSVARALFLAVSLAAAQGSLGLSLEHAGWALDKVPFLKEAAGWMQQALGAGAGYERLTRPAQELLQNLLTAQHGVQAAVAGPGMPSVAAALAGGVYPSAGLNAGVVVSPGFLMGAAAFPGMSAPLPVKWSQAYDAQKIKVARELGAGRPFSVYKNIIPALKFYAGTVLDAAAGIIGPRFSFSRAGPLEEEAAAREAAEILGETVPAASSGDSAPGARPLFITAESDIEKSLPEIMKAAEFDPETKVLVVTEKGPSGFPEIAGRFKGALDPASVEVVHRDAREGRFDFVDLLRTESRRVAGRTVKLMNFSDLWLRVAEAMESMGALLGADHGILELRAVQLSQ